MLSDTGKPGIAVPPLAGRRCRGDEVNISTVAPDTCGSCGRGKTVAHTACHTGLSRPKAAGCAWGSGHVGESDAIAALALSLSTPCKPFGEGIGFGFLPIGLVHAGHQ